MSEEIDTFCCEKCRVRNVKDSFPKLFEEMTSYEFDKVLDDSSADYDNNCEILKVFDAILKKDFCGFRKGNYADIYLDNNKRQMVIYSHFSKERSDRESKLKQKKNLTDDENNELNGLCVILNGLCVISDEKIIATGLCYTRDEKIINCKKIE